jgi:hypothetical protein
MPELAMDVGKKIKTQEGIFVKYSLWKPSTGCMSHCQRRGRGEGGLEDSP